MIIRRASLIFAVLTSLNAFAASGVEAPEEDPGRVRVLPTVDCASLLSLVERLTTRTYAEGEHVTLTFFDDQHHHVVRTFALERVRAVDRKVKFRLRAGGTIINLVGQPSELVPINERGRVTLSVHRLSGPSLGLGANLRASYPVTAER